MISIWEAPKSSARSEKEWEKVLIIGQKVNESNKKKPARQVNRIGEESAKIKWLII